MRCGKCCTSFGVCITIFDIERIINVSNRKLKLLDFVAITPEPPERERTEPAILINGKPYLLVLKWKKAQDCVFYDRKIGCLIYNSRPMLCRTYPFRLDSNKLKNMKSRACSELWIPEDKRQYITDLKQYEEELLKYKKIVEEWNKKSKGKGEFEEFLEFICLRKV